LAARRDRRVPCVARSCAAAFAAADPHDLAGNGFAPGESCYSNARIVGSQSCLAAKLILRNGSEAERASAGANGARTRAERRTSEPRRAAELNHGVLPGLLGYQLRLAQLALFRDFDRAMQDLGISPGRVGMLLLVEANPGLSQSRLALAVGLDRSTLVPVLDALERRGLLERRSGPDRRTNGLWLTARGKRFLATVKRRIAQHEERFLDLLTVSEREQLLKMLARLSV